MKVGRLGKPKTTKPKQSHLRGFRPPQTISKVVAGGGGGMSEGTAAWGRNMGVGAPVRTGTGAEGGKGEGGGEGDGKA